MSSPLRRIQTRRRNGFSDETTYQLKSKSIVYHWQQSNGNYDFAPLSTKEKTLSYQSVFLIDEEGSDLIDGGDYLCVTYRGNYEQSAYWGQQLAQYAHAHKFKIRGDLLEILWIDIHTTSDESEYITQLQLPIA